MLFINIEFSYSDDEFVSALSLFSKKAAGSKQKIILRQF